MVVFGDAFLNLTVVCRYLHTPLVHDFVLTCGDTMDAERVAG